MVLIIKKITVNRCDIVLIPKKTLNNMLGRHVDRKDFSRDSSHTTCIVTHNKEWTGKPSHHKVIKLLKETLENERIRLMEGMDIRYPIPHHLFHNLKCRSFSSYNEPVSETFDGDFVITFIRINGRSKAAIKEARKYEEIGPIEALEIKHEFKKIEGKYKKEFIWLAHHIHPA